MCVAAAKKRNKVLISATFNPRVMNVVRTYAKFHGVELVEIPAADGLTDREAITRELAAGDVAGVMVAQPNHYGLIEDFTGLADEVHAAKALLVINSIASTLAVLRSPGEWGADIACGDAQSLGIPMNFGGPHIGYLCVKSALVRKMPGRLVGETVDADGKRAFVLTMQAREQHIRREKATSNICTAQGIMCLYVAIYLSIMGRQGLVEVNEQSAGAARALREALLATGKFEEVFPGKPFLNEFALRYVGSESLETLRRRWAENGWLGGVTLDGMPNCLLFAATEQRTQEEIDAFAALV